MSSSWSIQKYWKLSTKNQNPSPTYQRNLPIQDSARNPESVQGNHRGYPHIISYFMERISLLTSLSRKVNASMTVEASVLLPMFLFFFLNLGCAIEMIRLHGNLQLALWQIGSKLSVYGYAMSTGEMPEGKAGEDNWWQELTGATFASTYVKAQVKKSVGEEYLNHSPLTDGASGLQFWESTICGSEDEIDIMVTYSVSPWSRMIGFSPFRMMNRYYAHIWNGYALSGETEETQIVYITESGTVYHLTRGCTHLQLSVRTISAAGVNDARNQYGGKYYPCEKCTGASQPGVFYITDEGNRYHYERECSGLKRTIYTLRFEDATAQGYRACSRCGH